MDIRGLIRDERGLVVNWLIKVIIGFVIIGILLFEVAALLLVRVRASDIAADAATEAGFTYRDTRSEERASETAESYAEREGAEFISLTVDEERRVITVTVQRTAKPLFIDRIEAFDRWITAEASESVPIV